MYGFVWQPIIKKDEFKTVLEIKTKTLIFLLLLSSLRVNYGK